MQQQKTQPHTQCRELRSLSAPLEVTRHPTAHRSPVAPLALFDHCALPTHPAQQPLRGGLLFAGGHISALNFHPTASGICALAAHRADSITHEIVRTYKGRAHIQLWRLAATPDHTACLGVVPHNGNCTWDLKWRPTPLPPPPTSTPTSRSHTPPSDPLQNTLSGMLAAALGDGTALVLSFRERFPPSPAHSVPHSGVSPDGHEKVSPDSSNSPPIRQLHPAVMTLRAHKKQHVRAPVRVVEWSPDGQRLVLGAADGNVEVYEAGSTERVWPRWCIPAQESVVTDTRWLSNTHLCTLGLSCVLRLRDLRDPASSLEQIAEGLAGSLTMDSLEPYVAAVGGDAGYLRVMRLSGIDGVLVKQPVKRVYLQSSSLRDIRSVSVEAPIARVGRPKRQPYTLLFAGGSEGMLHECVFPRPIWPSPDVCNITRTETRQKLRWRVKGVAVMSPKAAECMLDGPASGRTLHLHVGPDVPGVESGLEEEPVKLGVPTRKKKRTKAAGRVDVDKESNAAKSVVFGARIPQPAVITRIALSEHDDVVAVGIDDGFVVWVPMEKGDKDLVPDGRKLGTVGRPKKIKVPGRKRGRPRKHPRPEDLNPLDVNGATKKRVRPLKRARLDDESVAKRRSPRAAARGATAAMKRTVEASEGSEAEAEGESEQEQEQEQRSKAGRNSKKARGKNGRSRANQSEDDQEWIDSNDDEDEDENDNDNEEDNEKEMVDLGDGEGVQDNEEDDEGEEEEKEEEEDDKQGEDNEKGDEGEAGSQGGREVDMRLRETGKKDGILDTVTRGSSDIVDSAIASKDKADGNVEGEKEDVAVDDEKVEPSRKTNVDKEKDTVKLQLRVRERRVANTPLERKVMLQLPVRRNRASHSAEPVSVKLRLRRSAAETRAKGARATGTEAATTGDATGDATEAATATVSRIAKRDREEDAELDDDGRPKRRRRPSWRMRR